MAKLVYHSHDLARLMTKQVSGLSDGLEWSLDENLSARNDEFELLYEIARLLQFVAIC